MSGLTTETPISPKHHHITKLPPAKKIGFGHENFCGPFSRVKKKRSVEKVSDLEITIASRQRQNSKEDETCKHQKVYNHAIAIPGACCVCVSLFLVTCPLRGLWVFPFFSLSSKAVSALISPSPAIETPCACLPDFQSACIGSLAITLELHFPFPFGLPPSPIAGPLGGRKDRRLQVFCSVTGGRPTQHQFWIPTEAPVRDTVLNQSVVSLRLSETQKYKPVCNPQPDRHTNRSKRKNRSTSTKIMLNITKNSCQQLLFANGF